MILAALLMACLAGSIAGADTLFLRDPETAVVEASSGAQFGFENGAFRPIRGVFSFSPPGYPPLKIAIQAPSLQSRSRHIHTTAPTTSVP